MTIHYSAFVGWRDLLVFLNRHSDAGSSTEVNPESCPACPAIEPTLESFIKEDLVIKIADRFQITHKGTKELYAGLEDFELSVLRAIASSDGRIIGLGDLSETVHVDEDKALRSLENLAKTYGLVTITGPARGPRANCVIRLTLKALEAHKRGCLRW